MRTTAHCRHCQKTAIGKPYHLGGLAPKGWRTNFYGGFVCSPECDFRASLALEQTMPGHSYKDTSLGCFAEKHYKSNWEVKP
mgnify:CR=1 FL=1